MHCRKQQRYPTRKQFSTKAQEPRTPITGSQPPVPKCRRCGKGLTQGNNAQPMMLFATDVNVLDITGHIVSPKQWQKSQLQCSHLTPQTTRTMMMLILILFT